MMKSPTSPQKEYSLEDVVDLGLGFVNSSLPVSTIAKEMIRKDTSGALLTCPQVTTSMF